MQLRGWMVGLILFFWIIVSDTYAKKKMDVLIHMTEAQKQFFTDKVIRPFKQENRVKIEVVTAPSIDKIEQTLQLSANKIGLVKVPFYKGWSMVNKGLIKPINHFLFDHEFKQFNNDYILTWFGRKKGKQFFLPRKYETRIMVYRESKVLEAIKVFTSFRDTINYTLKKINRYGLPKKFKLEEDPSLWDYFDIFVIGFIWSQLSFNNTKKPRIAHRGRDYSSTALRLIDRAYQCNGKTEDILRMQGEAVIDAFEWEAVYTYANIYNNRMWEEKWDGRNIWEGFASEDVFLSFMTQIDCAYLYGTGENGLSGYLKDASDLAIAVMPSGCSIQLDENGEVERRGTKRISTGGWWWAIPKTCPDPQLAFKLYKHITSREIQLQECTQFGMIPVRKDILMDKSIIYDNGWISKIIQVSYKQIQKNDTNILPSHAQFDKISNIYLKALFDIVVSQNWSTKAGAPEHSYIADVMNNTYIRMINDFINTD